MDVEYDGITYTTGNIHTGPITRFIMAALMIGRTFPLDTSSPMRHPPSPPIEDGGSP